MVTFVTYKYKWQYVNDAYHCATLDTPVARRITWSLFSWNARFAQVVQAALVRLTQTVLTCRLQDAPSRFSPGLTVIPTGRSVQWWTWFESVISGGLFWRCGVLTFGEFCYCFLLIVYIPHGHCWKFLNL